MIVEAEQELAALYAAGALAPAEAAAFAAAMAARPELGEFVRGLESAVATAAPALAPARPLPPGLKGKVMARIDALTAAPALPLPPRIALPGLSFVPAAGDAGWKALPIPGAYLKLLTLDEERGYAVLLGKLDAGARYPAHINAGPEEFYILTGDLVVGDRPLNAGDFHHADGGSHHPENYSVAGCTLLAVLTTQDPLVAFARA